MATHSQIRAEQRYGLSEFNPLKVMKEILDDHCEIWIKNDDNAGAYVAMLFPYD